MKNLKYIKYWFCLAAVGCLAGCSDDFLEVLPQDAVVDADYYKSDEQVLAGTSLLYNVVWYEYNNKASFTIGDFRGGTAYSAYNLQDHVRFNVTPNTEELGTAWKSFYTVIGQSNTVIANINQYAGEEVSENIKQHAIAEARFMRALAYRYLVLNWGEVPIIENNLGLLNDPLSVRKNTEESIWKFITSEFRAAAANLPETPIAEGRLTKWAAEGMLARTYLTRAGLNAAPNSRNQNFLDSAKFYSQRVIELSGAALLDNYAGLFQGDYDNNAESLFSLQWNFSSLPGDLSYGKSNSVPASLAYNSIIGNDDGWGGDLSATFWMLSLYDGIEMINDSTLEGNTVDARLKATFMLPGMHYADMAYSNEEGKIEQGFTYPYVANEKGDARYAAIRKYVPGKLDASGAGMQNYGIDTYMLRLAEVYLIYAEAALGNNASTTDATALNYFNAVHERATGQTFSGPLTFDDIFEERVKEFAMEGVTWYDLVRLHYYNPSEAYKKIKEQNRGGFYIEPNQYPNPTSWKIIEVGYWEITTPRYYEANSGNFRLPLPASEASTAPNLSAPAVDYYSAQ